jgi:hypothetical protein
MNHEFWITFALHVFTKAETKTFRVGALNLLVGPTLHAAAETVDYSSWTSNLNYPQQTTIPLVLGPNQWQIEAHDLVRCQKLPTFGWEGGILTKRKKNTPDLVSTPTAYQICIFLSLEYVARYVAALCTPPALHRVQPFPVQVATIRHLLLASTATNPLPPPSSHYRHAPRVPCLREDKHSPLTILFLILRTLYSP